MTDARSWFGRASTVLRQAQYDIFSMTKERLWFGRASTLREPQGRRTQHDQGEVVVWPSFDKLWMTNERLYETARQRSPRAGRRVDRSECVNYLLAYSLITQAIDEIPR